MQQAEQSVILLEPSTHDVTLNAAAPQGSAAPTFPKAVQILGTRGIPARHGGFESFAEQLAPFLIARGWAVTVYCQLPAGERTAFEDEWRGVRRIHLPAGAGAKGTATFDLRATLRCLREPGIPLVLGYNTAVFSLLLRLFGRKSVMNMDGIEWRRDKWPLAYKAWLWANEHCGAWLSTHLVADHPEIKRHLMRHTRDEKITVIPYSASVPQHYDESALSRLGISPDGYFLVIARPEPENSVLEIVRAFSQARRGMHLVVLGNLSPETNPYHAAIMASASSECIFPGAIYEPEAVYALRLHARAYVHGHTVGGTNPSLVEALAAGSAVIANDNPFNRWVAGNSAVYFADEPQLEQWFSVIAGGSGVVDELRAQARQRYAREFTEERVLGAYERMLENILRLSHQPEYGEFSEKRESTGKRSYSHPESAGVVAAGYPKCAGAELSGARSGGGD